MFCAFRNSKRSKKISPRRIKTFPATRPGFSALKSPGIPDAVCGHGWSPNTYKSDSGCRNLMPKGGMCERTLNASALFAPISRPAQAVRNVRRPSTGFSMRSRSIWTHWRRRGDRFQSVRTLTSPTGKLIWRIGKEISITRDFCLKNAPG